MKNKNKFRLNDLQSIIQGSNIRKSRHFLQFTNFKSPKQAFQVLEWVSDLDNNENPEKLGGYWNTINSLENAFMGADAVLVLTEWDEYKNIKLQLN